MEATEREREQTIVRLSEAGNISKSEAVRLLEVSVFDYDTAFAKVGTARDAPVQNLVLLALEERDVVEHQKRRELEMKDVVL